MSMPQSSDTTGTDRLLDRVIQGDQRAVNELLASHRKYLRRVVELRMDPRMQGRVDPSDVVQETQLVASRRIDDFLARRPTSFRLWIRRKALEQLAKVRRYHVDAEKRSLKRDAHLSDKSSLLLATQLLEPRPSQIAQRNEALEQVRLAVSQLAEQDQEIILLRHIEGLTNGEVAELLDIDHKTASKRYGRALRRVREKLIDGDISNA